MSITCESDVEDHVKKEVLPKLDGGRLHTAGVISNRNGTVTGFVHAVMSYNRQLDNELAYQTNDM